MGPKAEFDKYAYYLDAVQSPEEDAKFLARACREVTGLEARVLREDFCAAFALCCAWVKQDNKNHAFAIDIDQEPLRYGAENYASELTEPQRQRLGVMECNVLTGDLPDADIIAALNFSYLIFKERVTLKRYFERCCATLNDNGVLILDLFGGIGCMEPNEHETEHEDYSYFWDQDTYNPVNNHAMFHIHFKRKGEKKRERVFTYDWRLWTLPELIDMLTEVGFKKPVLYWEGSDEEGDGNGEFNQGSLTDDWESWLCYLVAAK